MSAPRRIAVVTGTRAEYGLLKSLLGMLRDDSDVELQLVVCAAHLSPAFGLTKLDIEADGFRIDAEVDMLLASDTPAAIAKSVGLGCIGFSDTFGKLAPHLVVLLGDRFEMLAAAQTALLLGIPIAHLHGGELTEGAVDESIRHAITKMAHLHFVAAEAYRRRVIQLGESPERVFNVGAVGLDAIRSLKRLDRAELSARFGIPAGRPFFLVSWHPETLGDTAESTKALLEALAAQTGHTIVFSHPNADAARTEIVSQITAFAAGNPNVVVVRNFGQQGYLSAMSWADAVVGNSSSGILEAPSLGVPSVNVGFRQHGRLRSPSVSDCTADKAQISQALAKAQSP